MFYIPDTGKSSLSLNIRLSQNSKYTANDLIISIINGNDIINQTSRKNPISNNYFTSTYTSFSKNKFNVINYYLQFIKYESDDGFLFPNSHIFNAKAFSQMTIMERNYIQAMDKKGQYLLVLVKLISIIIKEFILEYNLYWPKFQVS